MTKHGFKIILRSQRKPGEEWWRVGLVSSRTIPFVYQPLTPKMWRVKSKSESSVLSAGIRCGNACLQNFFTTQKITPGNGTILPQPRAILCHNQARCGIRLTSFPKNAFFFLQPPNNGKNFRLEILAIGKLEADYCKGFPWNTSGISAVCKLPHIPRSFPEPAAAMVLPTSRCNLYYVGTHFLPHRPLTIGNDTFSDE